MKKHFFLPLLFPFAAAAQQAPAIVQGVYNKTKAVAVSLYEVKDGEREEFAKTKLSAGNHFAFQLPAAKTGFYYLGNDPQRGGFRIYLSPGAKLNLLVTDSGYQVNNASAESKLLLEWETLRAPLRAMSRGMFNDNPQYRRMADTGTYRSFFPMLEAMLPKAEAFKKKISSPNKSFNELLRFTVDADMQSMAVMFLLQPRTIHPQKTEYPAYYQNISKSGILNTTRIYALGEGQDFISSFTTFKMLQATQMPEREKIFDFTLEQVTNDTLKGDLVARRLVRANSFEEVLTNVDKYGQFLKTERQLAMKEEAMEKLVKYQKGAPGYNFDLADINNKKVSLKSLAGKIVVVDVWATWCGPCKAEIPHLKTLTEEMKGKDVVFVSISTDKEADKEKWKQFVAEKELDGVQLYDPSGKSVISYYKIPGIPRFMVFDKAGNIVSVDAPRPSTPDLKKLIEQYL
ncbi:TlpA family protein disulfide reductase [Pseudobacter ginsenosidimutans]|uniref:Thiol-disulfide isomerase/thioredoxin n=1 Tax=Pseudobacter ginsenosidimutans TaxID=661488 RepID=A0A4V2F1Y3_9BACT|nr:TlpA disulfide reductase family protein [Pseudobacter ginsenosidimutans]QEC43944.1 TlpA family protein disulfide reductase [Pseudobacter ginsenosidimutans]RZS75376.1 thiol-disulfide isomerase/thioredoxin [Pseudobacter ginsenosidimutans]